MPAGLALTGDHSVTFSLYDDPVAGILLCSTNYNPLSMTNGLFNVTITGCSRLEIFGQQLYLGVQIDADGEMTPRQPIYAVPYARSLRPGADIAGWWLVAVHWLYIIPVQWMAPRVCG